MKTHHQIAIIGAGTAGIMTAAQLLKKDKSLDIVIIDPAEYHYYQPAWTLVGAGTYDYEETVRPMKDLIPKGVKWIQDSVTAFLPDESKIRLQQGGEIGYEYLIVAPGLVNDLSLIEGLEEAVRTGLVCSNYIDSKYTWECMQNFKGGNAVFTQPTTPIKCGGAPQKAMYLAADYFRKKGIDKETNVVFATPGTVIFGVKKVADTLMEVIHKYNVHFKPFYAPVKIDVEKKTVFFKSLHNSEDKYVVKEGNAVGETMNEDSLIEMPFDFLHLAPPQTAPKFVKESTLVNEAGWQIGRAHV